MFQRWRESRERANKTTAENGIKRLEDLAGKRPAAGGAS